MPLDAINLVLNLLWMLITFLLRQITLVTKELLTFVLEDKPLLNTYFFMNTNLNHR